MDWANERWIRLYTRDTGDWLMWPWQTRALFLFILRKVDRAGMLQLGKGKLQALAAMCHMPSQDVTEWIEPLVEDGCIQIRDGVLLVPNFIPAQEAQQTDKARQRASRERARDKFVAATGREPTTIDLKAEAELLRPVSQLVTDAVTACHARSQAVTLDKTRQDRQEERESDARASEEHRPSERRLKSVPPPPPSEAAPPPREPEGRESPTRPTGAASGGESAYDFTARIFGEAWEKKYREKYVYGGGPFFGPHSEDVKFRLIGEHARERGGPDAELYLRHWAKSYMRDDKRVFVTERHPGRFFDLDLVNKYGSPKKQPVARATLPQAAPAAPVSIEETKRRAEAAMALLAAGKPEAKAAGSGGKG